MTYDPATAARLPAALLEPLMRAHAGMQLLALLSDADTRDGRIQLEHTATLARYVSEDMGRILSGIEAERAAA